MPSSPHDILRSVFGHQEFRGLQEPVITRLLAGQDTLLLMPTGQGKSLCYQIPALLRPGLAVVVSPLIALMQDQVTRLQSLGVRAAVLNSSLTTAEAWDVKRRMMARELDLLYVAPERLVQDGFLRALDQLELALFAIDEAHCVSQWGHNFRPEYLQLHLLHQRYPAVPRLALTATADMHTRAEILKRLEMPPEALCAGGFDRPNISYVVSRKTHWRRQILSFLRSQPPGASGIIYRLTRKSVDATAEFLQEAGVNAIPYHAGMDDDQRRVNQQRFLDEPGAVVVATIAFGMGIDKADVRFVAHLDMPKTLEDYHQQTGRAGRDGLPATAWLAFGVSDVIMLRKLIEGDESSPEFKQIELGKLRDMSRYCEAATCRRRILLRYFGEDLPHPCGNCDICRPDLVHASPEPGPELEPRRKRERRRREHPAREPVNPHERPDRALFDALRAERKRLADDLGVPAFVVFPDTALRDMALRRPRTEAEFLAVKGVGEAKCERFAKPFLEAIRRQVEADE
ncbi:MAG: RecQ family ATP-dependent DNA helicase [Armatimonadetes bacterium]|nr:RecQ family ATP-dependent DNA helicase [Armatimonadota bacterium]